MTSERKILANRQNAKKSTGPKTTAGKSRASRNAVRHGLEAASFGNPGHSAQTEHLARAICPDPSDPFRYEQAVIIAESQIFLARVRAARIAAIERVRKNTVGRVPVLEQGNLRKVTVMVKRASKALRNATKKFAAGRTGTAFREDINAVLEANRAVRASLGEPADESNREPPDEMECLSRALPELLSLERYERRALSRRRRAIRRFDALA